MGKKTNAGEIGCYLSHYKAISRFLETDKKYTLILEDDALWNPDFIQILNKLIEIKDTWDFVKFNTARDGGIGNIPVGDLIGEYKLYASVFPKAFSAAYIINRKAATSLKSKLLPMFVPYDHEMVKFWKYGIKQYSVFPSPVRIAESPSLIDTYGKKSLKFAWYKRVTVFFYRVYTQLCRFAYFYKLLK